MSHALIIGAGPAGLMAAETLSAAGHQVTVADQMPSVGRKFLMAGKSGLNLTMDVPTETFLKPYGTIPDHFASALRAFGPAEVQTWARDLGQEIFTGSTGRVFPKVMKASPLLRAWLARLSAQGVTIMTRHKWVGWNAGAAVFETQGETRTITADVTVLALGGGSWARLGSDGKWAEQIAGTVPFRPSNCGFTVPWTKHMTPYFGKPVKATALKAGTLISRGEWVITARGIEGGGVYAISTAIRDGASLRVDLAPDVSLADLQARMARRPPKASRSQILKRVLRLSPLKAALFNEFSQTPAQRDPESFPAHVKSLKLPPLATMPLDTAISTAGGLRFDALTPDFMLRARAGVFAAGEMLDWDAPTGGYLINGALASGQAAARGACSWLSGQVKT